MIVHELERSVLAGVAEGAVGDRGLRAVAHHGVGHSQGREDGVREELPEGLSRDPLDDQRQHLVAGVRVLIPFARGEQGGFIPGGQKEHRLLGVGHALCGLFLEDVVVVRQPRGVGQEVAQRDRVAESLELGQELHHRVVVVELAAFGQDHDRHGGELFRNRGQPEGGLRSNGFPAFEVGESKTGGVQDLIVPHHHDRSAGRVTGREGGEEGVDPGSQVRALARRGTGAAPRQNETDDRCDEKPDARLRVLPHVKPPGRAHHRRVRNRG